MEVFASNGIVIRDPDRRIMDYCMESLTLDNPDFYKKQRLGKWIGNTPKEIRLYEKVHDEIVLPFGCLNDLWKIFPEKEHWHVGIHEAEKREYKSSIKTYDYQETAVREALRKKNGILVMPCGSGKTQCGLEIIARLGCRALWLTHTQDLLNQSMERAKSVLDLQGGRYGTITAGKVDIGTHITFATVQTMCKIDLLKHKHDFDIVVIDEVQHCAGTPTRITQFYKVVTNLSARYKIGLTATPKRADGLERSMFAIVGDIIHEVPKSEVEKNTCPIKVEKHYTGYIPDYNAVLMGDGTLDYAKIIDDMIHNHDRFNKVFNTIANLPKCQPIIVLANRVEYLKRLCDEYNLNQIGDGICISGAGQSKRAKEERKTALRALNSGELDCIFATYQLAKEGLDVPNLRYVVFATPEKDETTVIQAAGRVGRKADGKEYGTVIDFIDDFGMYVGWSKKRDRCYKKIGAEILT